MRELAIKADRRHIRLDYSHIGIIVRRIKFRKEIYDHSFLKIDRNEASTRRNVTSLFSRYRVNSIRIIISTGWNKPFFRFWSFQFSDLAKTRLTRQAKCSGLIFTHVTHLRNKEFDTPKKIGRNGSRFIDNAPNRFYKFLIIEPFYLWNNTIFDEEEASIADAADVSMIFGIRFITVERQIREGTGIALDSRLRRDRHGYGKADKHRHQLHGTTLLQKRAAGGIFSTSGEKGRIGFGRPKITGARTAP